MSRSAQRRCRARRVAVRWAQRQSYELCGLLMQPMSFTRCELLQLRPRPCTLYLDSLLPQYCGEGLETVNRLLMELGPSDIEQHVDARVPYTREEIVHVPEIIPQELVCQQQAEQVMEAPVPKVQEDVVRVPTVTPPERIHQQHVEQTVEEIISVVVEQKGDVRHVPVIQTQEGIVQNPVEVYQAQLSDDGGSDSDEMPPLLKFGHMEEDVIEVKTADVADDSPLCMISYNATPGGWDEILSTLGSTKRKAGTKVSNDNVLQVKTGYGKVNSGGCKVLDSSINGSISASISYEGLVAIGTHMQKLGIRGSERGLFVAHAGGPKVLEEVLHFTEADWYPLGNYAVMQVGMPPALCQWVDRPRDLCEDLIEESDLGVASLSSLCAKARCGDGVHHDHKPDRITLDYFGRCRERLLRFRPADERWARSVTRRMQQARDESWSEYSVVEFWASDFCRGSQAEYIYKELGKALSASSHDDVAMHAVSEIKALICPRAS